MNLCFIITSALFVAIEAKKGVHRDLGLILCSDTEAEMIYGLDGEEMWHADFIKEKGVMTMPDFADPYSYVETAYEFAVGERGTCRSNLAVDIDAYKNPPEPKVRPESSIYTKTAVKLGSKNTLICYIAGFYPPHVEVTWSKNNEKVTDGINLSRYYITTDGNFNLVSSLSFTPVEGDTYACTVNHKALETPLTKIWEVDVEQPSVGPAVFCGVGLVVGLLGVATGTFFLIKGNNCN